MVKIIAFLVLLFSLTLAGCGNSPYPQEATDPAKVFNFAETAGNKVVLDRNPLVVELVEHINQVGMYRVVMRVGNTDVRISAFSKEKPALNQGDIAPADKIKEVAYKGHINEISFVLFLN